MSKVEKLQKKISKLQEELKIAKIEEMLENLKPTIGDDYWYLGDDGEYQTGEWDEFNDCLSRWEIGNVFRTQEELIFHAERLRILAKLKRYATDFEPFAPNWYVWYNHEYQELHVDVCSSSQEGDLFFKSRELAQRAVEDVGEDDLLKYYFKIKKE